MAVALLVGVSSSLWAAGLPRDALWRVEQTCLLDHRITGSSFPCLDVIAAGGTDRGVAVLRAPLSGTHIVVMPTIRVSGVEDAGLRATDAPNYPQAAWEARHFVQAELARPLAWDDFALAINSRPTRSQDQLHIHVDCVRQSVKRALSDKLAEASSGAWLASGLHDHGQTYWLRRLDRPSLDGINLFQMADEIPAIRQDPDLLILAVIGVRDRDGHDGFLILAGQSDPARGQHQATSETLLDHTCRGRR